MGKIIKKGTRVRFHGNCNLVGSDTILGEFVTSDDLDSDDLDTQAYEAAVDYYSVEGWSEVIEENEEDE